MDKEEGSGERRRGEVRKEGRTKRKEHEEGREKKVRM